MCFSSGYTAHWTTHPRFLHSRGGRSRWLSVLKTDNHLHPAGENLSRISQGSSCQSINYDPTLSLPTSSCPPDRLTPRLSVRGPIQR